MQLQKLLPLGLIIGFLFVAGCQEPGRQMQASGALSSAPGMQPAADRADETVWVGKSDEALSCETGSGIELYTMENELKGMNIKVFEKRKVHDTKMRIQMCGVDKGNMNAFRIFRKDIDKAKAKGFQALSENIVRD